MASANDGLRLVERCVLGALAWWGFAAGSGAVRWVVGLGAPLLVAVVWATFVTPNGALAVEDPRLLLVVAIFGAGVAAVVGFGGARLALVFGIVGGDHLAFTFLFDQR